MKKKVIVLGGGLVGKAMAIDLAKDCEVTSADIQEGALQEVSRYGIKAHRLDFSDLSSLSTLVASFDLVIGAVPGFLGLQTAKTIIEAGRNMVDISFFPEDPFQ